MIKDVIRYLHKHETLDDLFARQSGKGVRIALLDSGVDSTHSELKDKVTSAVAVIATHQSVSVEQLPPGDNDRSGHGTGAAGIIAKIAPRAELADIRVLNSLDAGSFAATAEGLRCAIKSRVKIINMALGVRNEKYVLPLLKLLHEASHHNIIVVAAADNRGGLIYPAALPYVLTVNLGPGSNFKEIYKNGTGLVEFGGCGAGVRTCGKGNSYVRQTGNSFAAAHISGLTALLLEKWPDLPLHKVKFILSYYSTQNPLSQKAIREKAQERMRKHGSGG